MTEAVSVRREVHITPQDLTGFILSLGGVKFWIVAVFPMYVGWVLAQDPFEAMGRHFFIDDLRVVLGILVIGPLLGRYTLLLNVTYDMRDTDRANPRKQYVRAIEDLVEPDTILYAAWGFAVIGLLLAAYVSQNLIAHPAPGGPITGLLGPYVFLGLMEARRNPAPNGARERGPEWRTATPGITPSQRAIPRHRVL